MTDLKSIGVMRPRPTKKDRPVGEAKPRPEATAEGDLGRPPTMYELMNVKIDPEHVYPGVDHNAELEGDLAKAEVTVNGRRVVLSTIRTQEQAGLLLAEATREQLDAEAHYRYWRAGLGCQIVTKAKKEVPEWRVRQLIESEPNYLTFQTAISRAVANVLALKAVWETWGDD